VHEIKEMEVEEDVDMEELTQCEKCLVM
jgi:hypothetical protein